MRPWRRLLQAFKLRTATEAPQTLRAAEEPKRFDIFQRIPSGYVNREIRVEVKILLFILLSPQTLSF